MENYQFDLVVVGSGPSGQKAAIAAAKLGKQVAIVERAESKIGGVCLHTGTIPSKTIREAILFLSGFRHRTIYPESYLCKNRISMNDLRRKLLDVVSRERQIIRDQLERNNVSVFEGTASLLDSTTIQILNGDSKIDLHAEKILLAVGTKPSRPQHIPFDGEQVLDSDEILNIPEIPRSMVVIGGGVIGIEYALMFATLGVSVTVVDTKEQLLGFCDSEIVEHLMFYARGLGIRFCLGEQVKTVNPPKGDDVVVELKSGKILVGDMVFFSVGRMGDVEGLNLEAIGIETDSRGKVACDENFETNVQNIFAVGDVIGFPSLASTSLEQGRGAVHKMYSIPIELAKTLPFGLYTIPEIAMVGKTEKELTQMGITYESGIARFEELAKPHIIGDPSGMLKLLYERESHKLLGAHCIGDCAIEIIHLAQSVMHFEGTIDYFCNSVFNHPSMSEAYKVAALNGINRNKIVAAALAQSANGQPPELVESS